MSASVCTARLVSVQRGTAWGLLILPDDPGDLYGTIRSQRLRLATWASTSLKEMDEAERLYQVVRPSDWGRTSPRSRRQDRGG